MTKESENNPFKVIDSNEIYKNPWITLQEDKVIRPGGEEGIFGIVSQSGGSTVIPIDGDTVYLSREFRYAINDYSIEGFSGGIEAGESFLGAAKRELKEELGATADQWTDLGVINPLTAIVRSPKAMFMATVLTMGTSKPDQGEVIEVLAMPFTEAIKMVMSSQITHGATCVALQKIALMQRR